MKILLVQTAFLGDVILSTPLIKAIHDLHPGAELWMMTTGLSSGLVKGDPLLKGVISYDKKGREKGLAGFFRKATELRKHNFEIVYSLHKSYRTALLLRLAGIRQRVGFSQAHLSFLYTRTVDRLKGAHDVLRNLSLLKGQAPIASFADELRLFVPLLDIADAFGLPANGGYVVLVPGSAWKTKMWDWRGFREVAEWLIDRGQAVVLVGAKSELETCQKVSEGLKVVNLAGKTSIPEMMSVIQKSVLVVCNDSMSLHLASAFKIPTVTIFCATSPRFGFGPWKNRATVVERSDLTCKPCRAHGSNKCPIGTFDCSLNLPAREVTSAIEALGVLS